MSLWLCTQGSVAGNIAGTIGAPGGWAWRNLPEEGTGGFSTPGRLCLPPSAGLPLQNVVRPKAPLTEWADRPGGGAAVRGNLFCHSRKQKIFPAIPFFPLCQSRARRPGLPPRRTPPRPPKDNLADWLKQFQNSPQSNLIH